MPDSLQAQIAARYENDGGDGSTLNPKVTENFVRDLAYGLKSAGVYLLVIREATLAADRRDRVLAGALVSLRIAKSIRPDESW